MKRPDPKRFRTEKNGAYIFRYVFYSNSTIIFLDSSPTIYIALYSFINAGTIATLLVDAMVSLSSTI